MQEQKDVIVEAFDLSERLRAPVLVSVTRQMMYGRAPVKLGQIDHERRRRAPSYSRDPLMGYTWHGDPWATTGISEKHAKYHSEALAGAQAHAEVSPLNRLEMQGGERVGIVTAEQGYVYTKQAVRDLGVGGQVAILRFRYDVAHPT